MSIDHDDVLHIARLARLAVPESEVAQLRSELGAILESVGRVAELDLTDVEPMSHPLDLANVWDQDESRPSLKREDALSNAPDPGDGSFRVPAAGE